MTIREMMNDEGGNLGWCKPYISDHRGYALAVSEGEVVGMMFAGEDIKYLDFANNKLLLRLFARVVNNSYDIYTGYDDLYIATDAMSERSCRNCPWFDICDAMDGEVEE